MRYFIIKKLSLDSKGGLYFKYTKSDGDGMRKRDHVFTFDLNDAYCFNDVDVAASYADHLTEVMGIDFGIQAINSGLV